ncbi:MAG: type II toxin-antitoxin system VapC family toxin [Planctomycetes bacterium]|nr:type II toxin-antitoxin system VapC family toxin [Planctomycetota bacterium]
MKKLKIYLDTSVIGGSFDDGFKEHSIRLIKNLKQDRIVGVISEITIRELENAPAFVKKDFETYEEKLEVTIITEEIKELAENYIKDKIVTKKYYEDALHIACATVYQVDLLVSWNFKHIVNFNKIMQFNAGNIKNGYKALQIYSPMEVLNDEE